MLESSPLGKNSIYETKYNPKLIFSIPRELKRSEVGIDDKNPGFYGVDIWNHYELSWLNLNGKPCVGLGEISYLANTPNIIESKSMKLYFNSFNGTKFASEQDVINTAINDLSKAVGSKVNFILLPIDSSGKYGKLNGYCLDMLDVQCNIYQPHPEYLTCSNDIITEELYSNLLKSNCPMTNQPDWGSIYIKYTGQQIDKYGLLKYIVSLRDHNEFHEQCIERIFYDIKKYCAPSELTVYARYTRRGGIDINPYRTTNKNFIVPENIRSVRH